MKKRPTLLAALCLCLSFFFSSAVTAVPMLRSSFITVELLFARGSTTSNIYLAILTPQGVYHGQYYMGLAVYAGDNLDMVSWDGPEPAPVLTLESYGNTDDSRCPGIPSKFHCGYYTLQITTTLADSGCPWVASIYAVSSHYLGPEKGTYTSPKTYGSACPNVPVATYDVSWSPDYIQHEKTLQMASTGGTVSQTLHTYLMESGTLCDGGLMDSRGSYCRYVGELSSITVLGCNSSKVTSTAIRLDPMNQAIYDITVNVNTAGGGTIQSDCNFQFILNEL
ncbi:StfH/YfcO family fimbrial adhesin [Pseudocitrobacter cyperus]|uniref:StfH/YfcO family fimbrial adhesin n=1 Tax=Pseudocitrobacter cyperus TaxID=3112843 RepID=A0ABV0HK17_9ENTR